MSLFDQQYYALTKGHMVRMGIWPDQSKSVRIILPFTIFAFSWTLGGPGLIRLYDAWRDIDVLVRNTTLFMMGITIFFLTMTFISRADSVRLLLRKIEEHWEMFKNTPAVIVLDKYTERGRYITIIYSTFIYVTLTLFFGLCLSPMVLDFIDPLNETRPKIHIFEAEYGVDQDKYYWLIMAHTYVVVITVISMLVAVGAMYIVLIAHTCALFEVVGFNLELIANESTLSNQNAVTLRNDWHYKKIRHCIILHSEAISFADLIEDCCSGITGIILCVMAIVIVITGVQALINWHHPEQLIQQVALIIGQIFHLYLISIPGQEFMNRSGKIQTIAYNLDWPDMSVIAQKLVILIMMRSNKPCCLTAGNVYILSMETFGSALRVVISYFTIFAQMV